MIYIFNPDHDLALANFSPYYTPPATALQLMRDLELLPVWYGREGFVPVESENARHFADEVGRLFPLRTSPLPLSEITAGKRLLPAAAATPVTSERMGSTKKMSDEERGVRSASFIRKMMGAERIAESEKGGTLRTLRFAREAFAPWGWNPALRRKLLQWGADETMLPSQEALERLRCDSNRQSAVWLLEALKAADASFCGASRYCTGMEELMAYLNSFPGDKLLKMPLSGSGKGLVWVLGKITEKQADWCRRVIRMQGGVVAEPVRRKVVDFAMEFSMENGTPRFVGYSLFHTTASGAYRHNELLSDQRIEERLTSFVPSVRLRRLRQLLTEKLPEIFPLYDGFLGVDMMICSTPPGYAIHPCVEVNLRMNMGVVACCLRQRFMAAGTEGVFSVGYHKKPGDALSFHRKMQREHPATVCNGKITSGYLALTPITPETRYVAYIVAER